MERRRRKISMSEMTPHDLTPEQEAKALKQTAESDAEDQACHVNFRWQKEPLARVRKVAELMGVPYQNYIKQVLFAKATEDLRNFKLEIQGASADTLPVPLVAPMAMRQVYYATDPHGYLCVNEGILAKQFTELSVAPADFAEFEHDCDQIRQALELLEKYKSKWKNRR